MRAHGVISDSTPADFSRGSAGRGVYVSTADAEVLLSPTTVAEFSADSLPEGWFGRPWVEGGGMTQENGGLRLDGGLAGYESLVRGGRSLEFEATFASRPDQHAGFGIDYEHVPWAMFSTKWGRRLYARTHFTLAEDKKLSGDWLDAPHRFRIDWRYLDMWFSVDGNRVAHLLVPMPPMMRPLAGNKRVGGPPLEVAWMRMSPYATAGRFTSRIMDAGRRVRWARLAWEADVPDGTSVTVQARSGNTPAPGPGWSSWGPLTAGSPGRYLQYRCNMETADPSWSPVVRKVEAAYIVTGDGPDSAGPAG